MTTQELLTLAERDGDVVEASIVFGALRATHWICHEFVDLFWHEGIDGEEEIISAKEFVASYPNTVWTVNGS